jgi:hypothetical protein
MVPRIPPGLDLAAFAKEHLSYETTMFAESRDRLFQGVPKGFDSNVLVEACVFHLRNLIEFFYPYPTNVRPDDVTAIHYSPNWASQGPRITSALEAARKRAHKEMAHLTTDRKAPLSPDKTWDFGRFSKEMKPVIDAFILMANPATLPPETHAALRATTTLMRQGLAYRRNTCKRGSALNTR